MTIRFDESEVRATGRRTKGVNGMKLRADDAVIGMVSAAVDDDRYLLTVTRNGYGKRTPLDEYRSQSRYGYGLVDIKTKARNGLATAVKAVNEGDHLILVSRAGQIMRTRADEVSVSHRNTMGVTLMDVDEGDSVAAMDVIPAGSVSEASEEGLEDA
jgi:DNA gyrase subunit A